MKIWQKTMAVLSIAFALSACEGFVDKVDPVDPTRPVDASASQVLTSVEVNYMGFLEGDMARLAGMWAGYFTGTDRQYVTLNNYSATSADFDAAWANIFAGIVKNTRIVRAKSVVDGNRSMQGVAKIIEAHTLGMTAALWGDIPVTQAGDVTQFPNPTYQSQTEAYAAVQALLTDALADLNANVGTITGDFLYGGSRTNWIAAANTLRAKFFLHQGQYQQAITAATAGIRNPANSLRAVHGQAYQQSFSIYYSFLTYDRSGYMTADGAFAVDLILRRGNTKTNEDSRANFYYQEGLNTDFVEPNVLSSFDWGNDPSIDGFFAAEARFPLITFEENQLILAEANARLTQTDAALTALNGLRAYYNTGANLNEGYLDLDGNGANDFLYAPYVTADFQAGGIENRGTLGVNAALLREILEERYITFIGQLEGFNDVRRTNNALGVPVNQGNQIPKRFLYSQNEINANINAPKPVPGLFEPTAIFK